MRNAFIAGTGLYAPERVIDNEEAGKIVGEDISEFMGALGIEKRRIMADDQSTTDLAVRAGEKALQEAGLTGEDIDLLIVSTDTPDIISPQTSASVAGELGMRWESTFFDINSSCTGFVAAAEVAVNMIRSGSKDNVLVISVYGMTRYTSMEKGKFFALFSDGAGACVFRPASGDRGYVTSHYIGDGNHWDSLGIYVGGTRFPATVERLEGKGEVLPDLTFFRRDLINKNPEYWPIIINEALKKADLTKEDIDCYIFTQINLGGVKQTCENLGIPFEKTHNIMDEYGYTGNACIIMALHDAREKGRVKEGDLVALTASGVGYTMSTIIFRL